MGTTSFSFLRDSEIMKAKKGPAATILASLPGLVRWHAPTAVWQDWWWGGGGG
jgi:hypothetical protein